MSNKKIAVLGAGAWGTALAAALARKQNHVCLWGRDAAQLEKIAETGENAKYLPGISLPANLQLESGLEAALRGAAIVLLVVPAQTMRPTLESARSLVDDKAILVSCAKGIESDTGKTMSAIIKELCPANPAAVLSGPSFATDVASGLPTAVTVAMPDMDGALALARDLTTQALRCYGADDLAGVEYGGALKNVLAIAAGIVYGKNLGASALAALTTRGFAEMARITRVLGGRSETLTGLSGLGDLILTCGSEKSRNFAYGAALGRGADVSDLKLAEGVKTAGVAARIALENGIDAPLVDAVEAVLSGQLAVDDAIATLLSRPVKPESA